MNVVIDDMVVPNDVKASNGWALLTEYLQYVVLTDLRLKPLQRCDVINHLWFKAGEDTTIE